MKRSFVDDAEFNALPLTRRCELLEVGRSWYYYEAVEPNRQKQEEEEAIKRRLDYWHTKSPCSGVRKLKKFLENDGYVVNKKRIRRYMDEMGIYAVYPKPRLSIPDKCAGKYPYLLRGKKIFLPNQVWAVDITYIPMSRGHMYLTAIIDWYSRYIVGWALSDTLDTAPVLEAVERAVKQYGVPAIINSDQGSQFTSREYIDYLAELDIRQSMDGKARWVDNVIIERWFRSLKTEYVYLTDYQNPQELRNGITLYIEDYNNLRPHQSLDYQVPGQAYRQRFAA